jgi:hypothetical protein
MERDPVLPLDHFARHLGVHRVGIVQQRRSEEGEACVEQEPETGKGENDFPRTVRDREFLRSGCDYFEAGVALEMPEVVGDHIEA